MIVPVFDEIDVEIRSALINASRSIKIAIAYLTDHKIFDLLISKAESGVEVEIIISDEEINFKNTRIKFHEFIKASGKLFFIIQNDDSMLHHKFCVIDDFTVITGSYNWSVKAKKNYENIVVIKDPNVAIRFNEEFEKIKKESGQRVSERNAFIVKSGLDSFDNEFSGFFSSSLVVFCHNNIVDVSSFLLSILRQVVANKNNRAAYLSLRNTSEVIGQKFLSILSGISFDDIKKGNLDGPQIREMRKIQDNNNSDSLITSLELTNIEEFKAKLRSLKYRQNLNIVFVDGLERFIDFTKTTNYSRVKTMEPVIIELKHLSLELNIPIVISVELNEETETRRFNTELSKSDVGILEDFADTIFILKKSNSDNFFIIDREVDTNDFVLNSVKNRHGVNGRVHFKCNKSSNKFEDFEQTTSPFSSYSKMDFDEETPF